VALQCEGVPKTRSVLLTGATGFIGSRIAQALVTQQCDVVALVRPSSDRRRLAHLADGIRLEEGDFHEPGEVERVVHRTSPDVLIHAAWHATPGAYLTDAGNIGDLQASLDLFQQARLAGCQRMLGIGTCFEYDSRRGWLDEQAPLRPTSLYASTKAALFLAASAWAREFDVSFAWARLFYQYGPGEDRRRLIPSVATCLLAGLPVQVTRGDQVRDYLYVDDVADAVANVALSELEGAVNVGSGVPVRVRDVIAAIERYLDRPGLVQVGARAEDPDDPPFICANSDRLQRQLGWRPTTSLEVGIAQTITWWSRQVDNHVEQERAPQT
jgi:nucleoside-diphosphate-sugar epimerase